MISDLGLYPKPDGCQRILSLSSDVRSIISRHDPARWRQTLSHRSKDNLPFDPLQIPRDASLLFDSTVYIDQLKGQLPTAIVNLMASRNILHAAPALAELAIIVGALDPADRRTHSALEPIIDTLTRISIRRIITPTYEVWLEASVIAGILSRTQGIPKQDRRRFLNDCLLFLLASDSGCVLITRNSRDVDLLLQLKPQTAVFLYDKI
jgi:predicted nucleic acid-binding protein